MFVYDLLSRKTQGNLPNAGKQGVPRSIDDCIHQSADAVVVVFPFKEADTFSFINQSSTPLAVQEGEQVSALDTKHQNTMIVGEPIFLDSNIIQLSIKSSKEQHQGMLTGVLVDPTNVFISIMNPGDWIVAWIMDNREDAKILRDKIRKKELSTLNEFSSGLKFLGKLFSTVLNKNVTATGVMTRRVSILATSFSELDTSIYYDPLLTTNFGGIEFMLKLSTLISKRNALPETVNGILGTFISSFLGEVPGQSLDARPNVTFRIPQEIAQILGRPSAQAYIDILTSILGVQKYDGDTYLPNGLSHDTQQIQQSRSLSIPKVFFTSTPLLGWNNPMVAPFNNVPIWGILKQHSVPLANEMYTTLRTGQDGLISPHLIIRQIPFNTDDFVATHADNTKFRELPRWKVSDPLITGYTTGKSNSLRVNYVQVQATGGFQQQEFTALIRSQVRPRWDITDIERNGLFSYITQVQATYTLSALEAAQKWTDMVTDRMIGSHLKLSGSISLVGIQEPICVGDNLEYEGLLYHIEEIEHKLAVNPATGAKSFSTVLAISHGVPADGPVLPAISIRRFSTTQAIDSTVIEKTINQTTGVSDLKTTQTLTGTSDPVKHSDAPSSNFEEDKD